jgi:hypothetical protein
MFLEPVELLKEVRATRSTLEERDQRADQLERSINDIMRRFGHAASKKSEQIVPRSQATSTIPRSG